MNCLEKQRDHLHNSMVFVTIGVNIQVAVSECTWQIHKHKHKHVHASTHQHRGYLVNSFPSLYVQLKQRMTCDVNVYAFKHVCL